MSRRKVFLVGDGRVGSTFANDLLQNVRIDELVICDVVKKITEGDALDLEDLAPFVGQCTVKSGDYSDAKDADIAVITAGAARKPGMTRLDLVKTNVKILESIIKPIVESGFNGIFVVSANPVDILTTLTQKLSGFPKNKVIGTGTSLDTARLRVALSHKTGVNVDHIDAYVLGEHGDTSFENFDEAIIDHKPLRSYKELDEETLVELETDVRKKGGKPCRHGCLARCFAGIKLQKNGTERPSRSAAQYHFRGMGSANHCIAHTAMPLLRKNTSDQYHDSTFFT